MTASITDERRATVDAAARRVVLAGQVRWDRACGLLGLVVLLLAGLLAVVHYALRLWLPEAMPWGSTGGLTLATVGTLLLLAALLLHLWPPSAWRIGRTDRALRRVGVSVARSWPSTVRAVFPPVTDLRGHSYLPGLRRIVAEDAALVLTLGLPPVVVPGGTQAYLESGAAELIQRLGLAHAEPLPVAPGVPVYRVRLIPRDLTTETRSVTA